MPKRYTRKRRFSRKRAFRKKRFRRRKQANYNGVYNIKLEATKEVRWQTSASWGAGVDSWRTVVTWGTVALAPIPDSVTLVDCAEWATIQARWKQYRINGVKMQCSLVDMPQTPNQGANYLNSYVASFIEGDQPITVNVPALAYKADYKQFGTRTRMISKYVSVRKYQKRKMEEAWIPVTNSTTLAVTDFAGTLQQSGQIADGERIGTIQVTYYLSVREPAI